MLYAVGFWLPDTDRLAAYHFDLSKQRVLFIKERPLTLSLYCSETSERAAIEVCFAVSLFIALLLVCFFDRCDCSFG